MQSTSCYHQPWVDLKNRIIAMPAFVGGDINMAGIKWIASFPENIDQGIPRAHSVTILNEAETGRPLCTINTPLLSIIRTASVSGLIIKHFDESRDLSKVKVGITGFGPIGQYHVKMCEALLGDKVDEILVYDKRPIDEQLLKISDKLKVVNSWEDAYVDADIFMTCTVSDAPYIDKQPKKGPLHLNVSLRDYKSEMMDFFKDSIFVDDWEEVCREKTDIEMMHINHGLQEGDTQSIVDLIYNKGFEKYNKDVPIMFNPMGMAVFDIATGKYYYDILKPN